MEHARTATPSKRGWKPILLARGLITALASPLTGSRGFGTRCSKTTAISAAAIRP